MTNPKDWMMENAGGTSYPAVAFERPGYMVQGTVAEMPNVVQTESLNGTGKEESYVVALDVLPGSQIMAGKSGERQAAQPGQRVSVWFRPGQILNALAKATTEAGTPGVVAVGGMLRVTYTGDAPPAPGKPQGAKQYEVKYKAPAPSAAIPQTMMQQEPFPATPAPAAAPDPFATSAPAGADPFA